MPEGNLGRIRADPGQLEQVVMNLVVNARDAMPRGGRLSVETRGIRLGPGDLANCPELPPGDYARLTVADTGHGMDESTRSKIFEPFFTTKGAGKGTGLGLAVVHGVVKQSGGHITVESTVGVGTTFTLFFPVVESRDSRVHTELARVASRGTETILLVEDEDAVRRIARIGLESQGFVVIAAANGPEAITIATNRTEPLHILVTDVIMPEMGGRELAETIRTIKPGIRVLYMSGYTDDAVLQHGVEAATDAFIQKPFTPLGLARKVRSLLDEKL